MDTALKDIIKKIQTAPYLNREEEADLARRYRNGDERAGNRIIHAHMRMALKAARQYEGYNIPVDELAAQACEGLTRALAGFDPDRGHRFTTYARWWIHSAITEHVMRNSSIVRNGTSAGQKKLFFNMASMRNCYADADGNLDDEAVARIAEELSVREADVRIADARLSGGDVSLDQPIGEEGSPSRIESMPDGSETPELQFGEQETASHRSRTIEKALNDLSERDRRIVRGRYLSEPPLTLVELAERENVSRERIRQIEERALLKMRNRMAPELDA